jgi:hypothetical protein
LTQTLQDFDDTKKLLQKTKIELDDERKDNNRKKSDILRFVEVEKILKQGNKIFEKIKENMNSIESENKHVSP